jgi:hypothetical protein
MLQRDPKGLGGVEVPGGRNQALGEIGIDPPVPHLVGMGQGVAGDHTPEAHVVELGLSHAEAGLNVSQALPEGELGEGQAEELIPAREGLDLVVAPVAVHAGAEFVGGDKVHQLGKDRATDVHRRAPLVQKREYGPRWGASSNR